jgi:phenylalanyl-tRNA synthetase beta chain
MRIALSWLEKYLPLGEHKADLADLLTFAGIEVEAIQELKALGNSVVAAKVISAEAVPKTDHLKLCKIDIGDLEYPEKDENGYVQVICGAPNCESGMMAVLALPGTKLSEFDIAKARIRGIHSHGMLCSEKELGISDNHAGIIALPQDIEIGTLADDIFELPDTIFELEITPNRSDLLGYIGIARDLSARLGIEMVNPETALISLPQSSLKLGLHNREPELCPRYSARVFENVTIKQSPLWLKIALIKSGLRPINNIVDITNYVMLESGHPLHAFDYNTLAALKEDQEYPDIVVRRAKDKEEFLALDGKSYTLSDKDLVIADGAKASALAGVMGSKYSGISEKTRNIVLESAAFHPGNIRKTSYNHKISSDSSYRFERHLSSRYADRISDRASALIAGLAAPQAVGDLLDSYPEQEQEYILAVRPSRFKRLIGFDLDGSEMKDILQRLGFKYLQDAPYQAGIIRDAASIPARSQESDAQYYQIPGFRKDVSREADILEELARLVGYDKVPRRTHLQQIMDRHAYRIQKKAGDWAVKWGAYETLNYSFTDPVQMQSLGLQDSDMPYIHLVNPQSSNQSVMRVSLVPQLLTNLAYNINRAERDVRLFELAKVYHKTADAHVEPKHLAMVSTGSIQSEYFKSKPVPVDYYWAKGCFEGLLRDLGLACNARVCKLPYLVKGESFTYVHEGRELGYFGRIKEPVLDAWGIDANALKQEVWLLNWDIEAIVELSRNIAITFTNIPRYPAVVRDLSFLLSDAHSYQHIRQCIRELDPILVQDVLAFDEYRSKQIPEGYRSISLHIVLQDQEKTLTDERVDALMASVTKTLSEKFNITMR